MKRLKDKSADVGSKAGGHSRKAKSGSGKWNSKKSATLPAKKRGKKRNRKLKYQTQVKESGQARWGEVDEEANSGGGRLTTSLWRIHASVTEEVGMLLTLLLINCRVPGLNEYLLPVQNMDDFNFSNLKRKVWRMTELQGVIRCIQFKVNLINRCSKTYYLMSKLYKRIGKH